MNTETANIVLCVLCVLLGALFYIIVPSAIIDITRKNYRWKASKVEFMQNLLLTVGWPLYYIFCLVRFLFYQGPKDLYNLWRELPDLPKKT